MFLTADGKLLKEDAVPRYCALLRSRGMYRPYLAVLAFRLPEDQGPPRTLGPAGLIGLTQLLLIPQNMYKCANLYQTAIGNPIVRQFQHLAQQFARTKDSALWPSMDDTLGAYDTFLLYWRPKFVSNDHLDLFESILPRPPSTTLGELLDLLCVPACDVASARALLSNPIALIEMMESADTRSLSTLLPHLPQLVQKLPEWSPLAKSMCMLMNALGANRDTILEDLISN